VARNVFFITKSTRIEILSFFRACCVYLNPSNSPPSVRQRPRSLALAAATPADWNEFQRMLQESAGGGSDSTNHRVEIDYQLDGRVSRQQSCASSSSQHTLTPTEVRKFHVVKSSSSSSSTVGSSTIFVSRRCADEHTALSRSTSSQSTDSATSSTATNNRYKREKDWHESEGL
jgi:hypothetical protein